MTGTHPHGGTLADTIETVSAEQQARLIKQFDHESNFRKLVGPVGLIVTTIAVVLSSFHIYTAGFGLLVEIKHRAFHLALVLGLIFLVFPRPSPAATARGIAKDWGWALAFAAFYLYLGVGPGRPAHRVGRAQERRRVPRRSSRSSSRSRCPVKQYGGYGDRTSRHRLAARAGARRASRSTSSSSSTTSSSAASARPSRRTT